MCSVDILKEHTGGCGRWVGCGVGVAGGWVWSGCGRWVGGGVGVAGGWGVEWVGCGVGVAGGWGHGIHTCWY